jgi:8-amino-7-oxononanoate synthase
MSAVGTIGERISREINGLRERSLFRTLDQPAGVNLVSNDYLGLAYDPRLRDKIAEAVRSSARAGSTGSRLLSGNAREWEDLESEFAGFVGTEATLYFGSGYAANVGLLSTILRPGDVVFSDALNHASLIDGMRLSDATRVIYPHGDLAYLENALARNVNNVGARVIVTETVFSMEGDIAPLKELLGLAQKYRAELILDEAHAVGVMGPEGRGMAAAMGIERELLASVHTCGKALASAGAFVCGGTDLRNYLINRARSFVFSTAMPPYFAGQIRAALELARGAESERRYLQEIAATLRKGLIAAGIDCGTSATQIVPVMLGREETALFVAGELQRQGFAVKAIRPPTVPAGTSRIRLSLNSRVSRDEIRRLIAAIAAAKEAATKSLPGLAPATAVHA